MGRFQRAAGRPASSVRRRRRNLWQAKIAVMSRVAGTRIAVPDAGALAIHKADGRTVGF